MLNGYQELNSFKKPCLMRMATVTSNLKELNHTEVGDHINNKNQHEKANFSNKVCVLECSQ